MRPRGELSSVEGLALDFQSMCNIGERNKIKKSMDKECRAGIDHIFKIDGAEESTLRPKKLILAAELRCINAKMDVYTT